MTTINYPHGQRKRPVCEEVYWEEYDTAGNYHWHGTDTGHHVVKARSMVESVRDKREWVRTKRTHEISNMFT